MGGAGVRYSREVRVSDPTVTPLLACGGVGGLVVGAGPALINACSKNEP